jgi:3-hydroxyisobutyrate dehydrogenase
MSRTVAVLGTGIMGVAMSRNLAGAGMAVRAWNRTREKAEPLAEDGVTVADTPARAAEGADFLNTMFSDADAVAGAVSGGGQCPTLFWSATGIPIPFEKTESIASLRSRP